MAADLHYSISSKVRRRGDGEPLSFGDCFRYGTSKMNQRIEAWWKQQRAATDRWRQFFLELTEKGEYDKDSIVDRVVFLAIYLPILREEIMEFVNLWNTHSIRKQSNRPHVVPGIPHVLYHYPHLSGGVQCGTYVDPELLKPAQEDLQGFR